MSESGHGDTREQGRLPRRSALRILGVGALASLVVGCGDPDEDDDNDSDRSRRRRRRR